MAPSTGVLEGSGQGEWQRTSNLSVHTLYSASLSRQARRLTQAGAGSDHSDLRSASASKRCIRVSAHEVPPFAGICQVAISRTHISFKHTAAISRVSRGMNGDARPRFRPKDAGV